MDANLLKPVPQENENKDLSTEPFPNEEVFPCLWILESGPRKGKECGKNAFEGKDYCHIHEVSYIRKQVKEEAKAQPKTTATISVPPVPMLDFPKPNPLQAQAARSVPLPQPYAQQYQPAPQYQQPLPQIQPMSMTDTLALMQAFQRFSPQPTPPLSPQLQPQTTIPLEDFHAILQLFSRTCVGMAEALKNRD